MKVLILAGGSGTRLWPLSRQHYPKQFLKLGGERSFLQQTVERFLGYVAPHDLFVVTHSSFYHEVRKQISAVDALLEENIILEPTQKNTAPALALAIRHLKEKNHLEEHEVLFISPADHLITPNEKFQTYVKQAEKKAQEGGIITFGIRPHSPETGYGYIKAKGERVLEFVEKPDLERAKQYLLSGDYFWNSGMFAFTSKTLSEECQKHAPELLEAPFETLPSLSIDYALIEKSNNVKMIPLDLSWSDVGSWDTVFELLEKDEQHNAVVGEVETYRTSNSLLFADKRMIATIGMDGVIVIETDDVVLVAPKEEAQAVKHMVDQLKQRGSKKIEEHLTSHRPWGSYTVLEEGARYKIKRIHVKPRQKLSLQLHYHRSEHWVVVSGTAKVSINGQEKVIHEGESLFVPKSSVHRVENPGKVPLEIIEVQVGEYLGEDDIVRLEDVYGRLKEGENFKILLENIKENFVHKP